VTTFLRFRIDNPLRFLPVGRHRRTGTGQPGANREQHDEKATRKSRPAALLTEQRDDITDRNPRRGGAGGQGAGCGVTDVRIFGLNCRLNEPAIYDRMTSERVLELRNFALRVSSRPRKSGPKPDRDALLLSGRLAASQTDRGVAMRKQTISRYPLTNGIPSFSTYRTLQVYRSA